MVGNMYRISNNNSEGLHLKRQIYFCYDCMMKYEVRIPKDYYVNCCPCCGHENINEIKEN
jgi:hypothetical protein